jgi:hypothetical protein
MKRILFTLTLLASIGMFNRLQAQCSLSNVVVTLNSANSDGNGNCLVNLDISFDMQDNSGNKYIWINLYKSTDFAYQTYNYGASGAKGPLLSQIDGADHTHPPVAVIGINNNVSPVAYLASYAPDPTHITPKIGTAISNPASGNVAHFTLSGISFTVPGGCAGMILQGDVWSTQANAANSPIHCYAQGISFYGDPTINGQITCTDPRKFQILLSTVSTSNITTSYKVYLDYPTVGTLDTTGIGGPGHTDTLIYSSPTFIINSTTPYNSGLISYLPYSGRKPSGDQSLLVQVFSSTPSFSKTTYGMLANSCSPLPVSFISFNAKRTNSSNVNLTWQTAMESNNSGFAVERNIDGTWNQVAFVPSQAPGGNSQSVLSYSYSDLNSSNGISQYRLRQIDIDGKSKYSEIRAVRGESQSSKMIVYPNPSSNGTVNVVFEDATSIRDISLTDMNGRLLKSWKGVSNNNLMIDNLEPGFYALRVMVRETGEQTVQKIVINRR